jgi:subtilisin family serine protease
MSCYVATTNLATSMRAISIVLLAAFMMPLMTAGAAPEPTSSGQAIVGFDEMPPDQEMFAGYPVLKVEPRANYIVLATDDLAPLQALVGTMGIQYVEDDALMTADATPDDARYKPQYGPAQMSEPAAWELVGYASSDVIVAVLDSGIRATHQDVATNFPGGYDYVNNDRTPNDDCGHGTHVSGTVAAATNNGVGVAGMSQASILHHKVLGPVGGLISVTCSGSSSDINAAIMDAADQGADIISMSLGGGGASTAGNNAVNYAYNKGALIVAASGNDSDANSVSYPAAYANVIAVGATTADKVRASYSNGGFELEIVAPGSDVEFSYNSNDASYDSLSGTTLATAHVAGALALALSCDPTLSNVALRSLMQSTAEDLGTAGWDNLYGHGLLRIDSLVNAIGTCSGSSPRNRAPTAAFTRESNDLSISFAGTASSEPTATVCHTVGTSVTEPRHR